MVGKKSGLFASRSNRYFPKGNIREDLVPSFGNTNNKKEGMQIAGLVNGDPGHVMDFPDKKEIRA